MSAKRKASKPAAPATKKQSAAAVSESVKLIDGVRSSWARNLMRDPQRLPEFTLKIERCNS